MEKAEVYRLYAGFCKTLSDANRLLIITELAKGELSVNQLTESLGMRQANVSRHLGLLREHGLVNTRRERTTIFYSLSDTRIYEAIKLLKDVQSEQLERRHRLTTGVAGDLS